MNKFEATYLELRSSGHTGWGGEKFNDRINGWKKEISFLTNHAAFPKAPAKILELGSGAGDVSLLFSELGYEVSGIEISKTGVAWANEKAKLLGSSAKFNEGSASNLQQFNDSTFSAVIDGNCLHCIFGDDRKKFLNESRRVLNSKGVLYISTMFGDPKTPEALAEFDVQKRIQYQNGEPSRHMGNKDEVLNEISFAGFKILDIQTTENPWWDHLKCLAIKTEFL